MNAVRGGRGRTPAEPAVGRCGHQLQVAAAGVVEFGVAVPVERAGRGVVAGRPVLVVENAGSRDRYRGGPCQAAVDGAAGHDVDNPAAGEMRAEPADDPHPVAGVVGSRWVAYREERSRSHRLHTRARQEPVGPGDTTVGAGGKADIGGTAVEDAAGLESGDEGRAVREGVRLDLCGML